MQKVQRVSAKKKPVPKQRAPLKPIYTSRPGELVTMDIVEFAQSSRGYRYCLVVVDHFAKWLELFPLRNQRAETIAKKIFDCWIPQHGTPEQLHHDQGKNLTAEIIQEVCSFLEIWNTKTTPFHPQSDGQSERSIRTVNMQHACESSRRGSTELGAIRFVHLSSIQHSSPQHDRLYP